VRAPATIQSQWDHPRVGGGTKPRHAADIISGGPSPRGRGNLDGDISAGIAQGTIPAWAGEPALRTIRSCMRRDHPRVGGGTGCASRTGARTWGPSPRGRGNHRSLKPFCLVLGTIPAWAGEPHLPQPAHKATGDHPRVGGGTFQRPAALRAVQGPSPRGRGNQADHAGALGAGGTIPAWAGEPNLRHLTCC